MPRPGGLNQEIDPVCGTHVPIEARLSYIDSPTRLVDVFDPRDTNRALLHNEWTDGDLTAIELATGERTTYQPSPSACRPGSHPQRPDEPLRIRRGVGDLAAHRLDEGAESPVVTELRTAPNGQPTQGTEPLGEQRLWVFRNNRVETVTRRAAGVPNLVETITYDDNARVETVSDGRRRRRLSYDELGQVTSVTDEALDGSATTRTTCHLSGPGRGLLETVTPEGNRVRLVHDGEGRSSGS